MNQLEDSLMNAVKFHLLDNVQLAQYVSRFMDDWAFRRTIQPWDEKVCFKQPWLPEDDIRLQYTSNFNPITFRLYNSAGELLLTKDADTLQQNVLQPTFYIRQVEIALLPYPPGYYFLTRAAAGQLTYSEPFEIIEPQDSGLIELEDENPTLLAEFSNYEPYQGIKFQSPFEPMFRFPAILRYKNPGSKDNVYDDQLLNATMVHSVPYRVFELIIGGRYGVPPWLIDKINRMLGCSTFKLDGRLYTKNQGATFEPVELDLYPMAGWSIELREKLNRDSVITNNDVIIPGIAAAALMVDTAGFGLNGGASDYQEIISLQ